MYVPSRASARVRVDWDGGNNRHRGVRPSRFPTLRPRSLFCCLNIASSVWYKHQGGNLRSLHRLDRRFPQRKITRRYHLFACNHLQLSVDVSDMRSRDPGPIMGYALCLSIPFSELGWRLMHMNLPALGTGRVRQVLECRASRKFGAGIDLPRFP